MSSYRVKAYLKYRRKAHGRHGTHSPFVYAFVEQGLRKRQAGSNLVLATTQHRKLINKIIGYFQCRNIVWLTNPNGEPETYIQLTIGAGEQVQIKSMRFSFEDYSQYPPPDLLLIDMHDPADWQPAFEKYKQRLAPGSMVLIPGIHLSACHTTAWERVCGSEDVKLSIDLFKVGLLFFREEFKEKQHFVVK